MTLQANATSFLVVRRDDVDALVDFLSYFRNYAYVDHINPKL
jgi:hypothetical protein